jgi:hypothetical protein
MKMGAFTRKRSRMSSTDLLPQFRSTLSKKSLPQRAVENAKLKVKRILEEKNVEVPRSATWLHKQAERLRSQGRLSVENQIDSFQPGAKTAGVEEDQKVSEEEDQDVDSLISVSRSLKQVINPQFDYTTLRTRIENVQATCSSCIFGLSKAVEIMVNTVLFDEGETTSSLFNLEFIDLNNRGIGLGELKIGLLNKQSL